MNHPTDQTAILGKKQILVIGSTCVDIIINIDHLPRTAEDIHPFSQSMSLGGCAYNAANMIRLFGAPVTLISPVGTGFYGEYVKKELKKKGFKNTVEISDQENGCCYCLVETSGERTFMSCHGAEYTFQKKWMEPYENKNFDMVYICGLEIEEPTGKELIEYLELYPDRELFYAPGPRGILVDQEKTDRIFSLHPILHINEAEALAMSQCSTVEKAANVLLSQTKNTVLITLGNKGTYCLEKNGLSYLEPSVPTEAVDTIGAGDSHIGTIMACLSLGCDMRTAIRAANQIAAAVVSIKGASLPEEKFDTLRKHLLLFPKISL